MLPWCVPLRATGIPAARPHVAAPRRQPCLMQAGCWVAGFVLVPQGTGLEPACASRAANMHICICWFHTEDAGFPEACFKIAYDHLVIGVG